MLLDTTFSHLACDIFEKWEQSRPLAGNRTVKDGSKYRVYVSKIDEYG